MNLREVVATMECQGKPEFSEDPVVVIDTQGRTYTIQDIAFEADLTHEDSVGHGTVWVRVEEN